MSTSITRQPCRQCGGIYDISMGAIMHAPTCPWNSVQMQQAQQGCVYCGALRNISTGVVAHKPDCKIITGASLEEKPGLTMVDRLLAPEKPTEAIQQGTGHIVSSLGAKRFEKESKGERDPSNISIRDALEAALAWLQDNRADHVLIMLGTEMDGGAVSTKFLQAGTYNVHAQIGLAGRCQAALMNPEGNLD